MALCNHPQRIVIEQIFVNENADSASLAAMNQVREVPDPALSAQGGGDQPPVPFRTGNSAVSTRGSNKLAPAFLGRGLGVLTTALAAALLPRLLPQQEFGQFSLVVTYVLFTGCLAQMGLGGAIIRCLVEALVASDGRRLRRILAVNFRMLAVSSLGVSLLSAAALCWQGPALWKLDVSWSLAVIVFVLVLLTAWQQFLAECLRGLHASGMASLFSGGQFGGSVSTLVLFTLLGAAMTLAAPPTALQALPLLALGLLATVVISGWTLRTVAKRTLSHLAPGAGNITASELLQLSLPILIWQTLTLATLYADVFIAGQAFPLEELATYQVARRWCALLSLPMQLVMFAVAPSIPDLYARGELDRLQKRLRMATTLAALPGMMAGLILVFAPGWILRISGAAYDTPQAGRLLAILSLGQITMAFTGIAGYTLTLTGKHLAALAINASVSVLVVSLGWFAAHRFGGVGLAITFAAGAGFQSLIEWLVVRRLLGFWTHADFVTSPQSLWREIWGG